MEQTAEASEGGATTRTAVAEAATAAAAAVAEGPEKMMSSVRMAGMKTALALQARVGSTEELPEELGYDLLVGADGAMSKVRACACLR